jgi:hypothetical protein
MSYIKYGNFDFEVKNGYPVPQISLSTEQDRDGAGKSIGSKTIVSLEGVIYARSGTDGFSYLTTKESGLRQVFQSDGLLLQIGCTGAGSQPVPPYFSGYAKVNRYTADKTNNYWLNTIAYNIELQIDNTGTFGYSSCAGYAISSSQDEWNIETIDELSFVNNPVVSNTLRQNLEFPEGSGYPTYRISRTVGAVGKFIPSGIGGVGISAITNAKNWVVCSCNHSSNNLYNIISGIDLYNFTRSISASDVDGSYRITDNWIGVPTGTLSGGYTESYSVESSLDNSYLRTVTINGTIKGLEKFNNTNTLYASSVISTGLSGTLYPTAVGSQRLNNSSKFQNALNAYSGIKSRLFNRAQSFISRPVDTGTIIRRFFGRNEADLNPLPLSLTEGYNPTEGIVTYSWVFNNRPLNLISGSISEVLTVNDTFPTQQIAEVFVLGRRLGPILQDLGTYTSASRDITFEVTMLRPTGLSGLRFPKDAYTAITGIVETFNPSYLLGQCKSFVKSNTENWYVSEGRFVKSKGWTWTKCDSLPGANPNN